MLYMATGKPAHLGCKFLLDVSVDCSARCQYCRMGGFWIVPLLRLVSDMTLSYT